ncbi:olfactory receptor 1361-like [Tachyglossus aculeatus]|uniref:olfactory receptor 1361-like n=1 Tax=Tachyglossus aculeatus TaxID=9261 RepID=UPI0018F45B7D|nr:olfactory receptor 1361-like [Tachyglossus aculeatus]
MSFFLANLSLMDVCFASTTVSKMLTDIRTGLDEFLLAALAYDHFMDICQTLGCVTAISSCSSDESSLGAVSYAAVTPLLDPFIYSLCNHDLHQALHTFFCKRTPSIMQQCQIQEQRRHRRENEERKLGLNREGCLSQLYFFLILSDLDNLLLAVMAYDRFLAICRPLGYTTAMGSRCCFLLVAACWVITNLVSLLDTILVTKLSFCADHTITHFCDLAPLLQLSFSDTSVNKLVVLIVVGSSISVPFTFILVSYTHIVTAVLRVPSARGRFKAFSTFGSHLAVVFLFYGTLIAVYFLPSSMQSPRRTQCLRNCDLHRVMYQALCNWDVLPAL